MAEVQAFPGKGTEQEPYIVESISDIFTPEVGVYYYEKQCNGEFLFNQRKSFELIVDFTAVSAKLVEEDNVQKLYRADVPEGEDPIPVLGTDNNQLVYKDTWKEIHVEHADNDVLLDQETDTLVLTNFKQVINLVELEAE